jgi:hypothetical protein
MTPQPMNHISVWRFYFQNQKRCGDRKMPSLDPVALIKRGKRVACSGLRSIGAEYRRRSVIFYGGRFRGSQSDLAETLWDAGEIARAVPASFTA